MVILQITLDLSYQLHKHTSQFRIQYTHSGTSFFNCRRWALRHIRSLVHRYQDVIVIACGGGITAVLPLLLYLVNCMRAERAITRRVRLVWMVRKAENMGWISEELASLALGEDSLTINVYVTDRTSLAGSTYSSMGATPVTVPLSTDKIDVSIDSNSQKDSGDTLAKEMIIRGPGHSLLRLGVRPNITEVIHGFVGNQRTAVI